VAGEPSPLVLPTLVITYGAASVVVALKDEFLMTYGATSWIAAATGLAAGLGLILAGIFVWVQRPAGSLGPGHDPAGCPAGTRDQDHRRLSSCPIPEIAGSDER